MDAEKILIVDGSKLMHRMFEVQLRSYSLLHAYDGEEGLRAMAEHPDVDLVLLDLNLSGTSDIDFLKRIKADDALKEIPVMVIGVARDEAIDLSLEAGAAVSLTKPFTGEQLVEVIQRL